MTSTTKSAPEEIVLKADRLGRVTMPVARRELILDRFEASGMSGQAFAKQIGVKYPTFANWVQKRRRARGGYANEDRKPVKAPLALVEAIVEEPTGTESTCLLEVESASGIKLRVKDTQTGKLAVEFLKMLRDAEL